MRFKRLLASCLLVFSVATTGITLVTPVTASASANCTTTSGHDFFGLPPWYKYLCTETVDGQTDVKFDPTQDIPKVLLALFEIILRISGLVAVGFVIFGGFQLMISQGEPDRIKGARTTITNALVGLVIAISATVIVSLIGGTLK